VARVLLIDDDAPLREVLAMSLRRLQHEVIEAETGKEGLRRFRDQGADIVVTDLVMPEEDGLGVLLEMQKISPATPIIVISGGLARSGLYRDMAAKLGATCVLAKPFSTDELDAAIRAALGKRQDDRGTG
jgi:DNA-binding response OmpR family regulator